VINSYRQLAFQNPFGAVSNLVVRPANPQNPLPVFTVDDPLAQATRLITNNRNGMQRNLRDGQVLQWNLTLQYLITKDTLFEAAYHGSKSSHLMGALNYNETNPFPPQPPSSRSSFRIHNWVTLLSSSRARPLITMRYRPGLSAASSTVSPSLFHIHSRRR
jgi:hypothetical protein